MRITKEQASQNRARVLEIAAKLFRKHGFDGIGVADLMKSAGFTHGGFYNHFASKEALMAQASAKAFVDFAEGRRRDNHDIMEMLSTYLSPAHRAAPEKGCPAAALGADAARQTDEVKSQFAAGISEMVRVFESALGQDVEAADRRELAIGLLSQAVGALILSRSIPLSDPLWREILEAAQASSARDVACSRRVSGQATRSRR